MMMKTVAIQEKHSIQLAGFANADRGQLVLVMSTLHTAILLIANADVLVHIRRVLHLTHSVMWLLISVF